MKKNVVTILCITGVIICIALLVLAGVYLYRFRPDDSNAESSPKERIIAESPVPTVYIEKITGETRFVLQKVIVSDKTHDQKDETYDTVPAEFIALTENEINNYLKDYLNNIPVAEQLEGLSDYEIIEFSSECLVLRKTYITKWNGGDFFVQSLEGEIVVYYSDKENIFDYTGIDISSFSEEEQLKLKLGFYVEDEESLYALLESYSS